MLGEALGLLMGGPLALILVWVGTAGLHAALSWAVSPKVAWAVASSTAGGLVSVALGMTLVGAGIGAAQSLVLGRQIEMRGWILASFIGWGLGAVVGSLLLVTLAAALLASGWVWPDTDPWTIFGSLVGAASGTGIGLGQWLILRQRVATTRWWALANTLGFSSGWLVGGLIGWQIPRDLNRTASGGSVTGLLIIALAIATQGLVGGAVTGRFFIWLLRDSLRET